MIVTTSVPTDREVAARHQLRLQCTDSGEPALTASIIIVINVVDIDDHAPRFTQSVYNCSVRENSQPLEVTRSAATVVTSIEWTGYLELIVTQRSMQVAACFYPMKKMLPMCCENVINRGFVSTVIFVIEFKYRICLSHYSYYLGLRRKLDEEIKTE